MLPTINWDKTCEEQLNKQIQLEYWASYQYDLIWAYFNQSNVASENIANFFLKSANEERTHAHTLMDYQNKRGGAVVLTGINPVDLSFIDQKSSMLSCFTKALEMEQVVYCSLKKLTEFAALKNDHHFSDFITNTFLDEQIKSLDEINRYITQLEKIQDSPTGEWLFDKHFK